MTIIIIIIIIIVIIIICAYTVRVINRPHLIISSSEKAVQNCIPH